VRVLQPPDGTFAPTPGPIALEPELVVAQPELLPDVPEAPGFPLVVVHWLDAWYDPDEQTAEDWRDEYPIRTVGYLVREEVGILSIAQEVLPDGEGFRAVTHIPRPMVQRIDRLVPDVPGTRAGAQPA